MNRDRISDDDVGPEMLESQRLEADLGESDVTWRVDPEIGVWII
jgi:hypothetical protein